MTARRREPHASSSANNEKRSKGHTSTLGDAIAQLFAKNMIKGPASQRHLQETWIKVAGDTVSKQSRVIEWKNDTLTVGVKSTPLRYELESFQRADFEESLRRHNGFRSLRRIRFVADPS